MLEDIKSKVDYHSVKNARKLVLFVNIANTLAVFMLEMFKSSVKCVFGTQLKEGVKCVCRVYCFYTRS